MLSNQWLNEILPVLGQASRPGTWSAAEIGPGSITLIPHLCVRSESTDCMT